MATNDYFFYRSISRTSSIVQDTNRVERMHLLIMFKELVMKKWSKLTTLAVIGLTTGLGLSPLSADEGNMASKEDTKDSMSEEELMSQLNDESKRLYQSLTPEGRDLARKLAAGGCKGMNDCKGMGSCKGEDHSCAGMNSCKGKSPGPFHDPNLAVKVAAKKMAEKRAKPTSQGYHKPATSTQR